MIVVDTSAIMAIALDKPERETLIKLIANAQVVFISAATLVELKIVLRSKADERAAYFIEELVSNAPFQVVQVDAAQAELAFRAYVSFGKGSGHLAQLNYGDIFSYALAKARNLPLLFVGNDFVQTDVMVAQ